MSIYAPCWVAAVTGPPWPSALPVSPHSTEMPPNFPRKQVQARSSHLAGLRESKANLGQTGCPNTCSWGYCQARTRYLGTLTESCWGPEPGPGPGRVWPILDRCFLSSQGSRALSRRRGSLGSCSIRPAGPQHHGKGRQQSTGAAEEVAGPKADVQGEGAGGWARPKTANHTGPVVSQLQTSTFTLFPSLPTPAPTPRWVPEVGPLALPFILPVCLQRESNPAAKQIGPRTAGT